MTRQIGSESKHEAMLEGKKLGWILEKKSNFEYIYTWYYK